MVWGICADTNVLYPLMAKCVSPQSLQIQYSTYRHTVHHVPESDVFDMICVNICNAAAPRGTPLHWYAGTWCPAPKTRRYENVPAFLYRPADSPLTV